MILAKDENPHDWLARAEEFLEIAKSDLVDHAAALLHNALLAGELAIKSMLISRGINFDKSHDLNILLTHLDVSVSDEVERASSELNYHSVQDRYPGHGEPVDDSALRDAIKSAETLIVCAKAMAEN